MAFKVFKVYSFKDATWKTEDEAKLSTAVIECNI